MDFRQVANVSNADAPHHAIGAYKAWRLTAANDLAVDMVWVCGSDNDASYRHRILPLGEPSIAVKRRRDLSGAITEAELIVCGPHDRPCLHQSAPNEELIAVRLKPEFAAQIFGVEPAAFQNQEQTGVPSTVLTIFEKTRAAMGYQCPRILAGIMVRDIETATLHHDMRERAEHLTARALRAANGAQTIRRLADTLDISERQLRRRFRTLIGCSPKNYARRLRVSQAAILADATDKPHWAQIAAETGFHDQAHMITSFKALSGLTPAALHRERRQGEQ